LQEAGYVTPEKPAKPDKSDKAKAGKGKHTEETPRSKAGSKTGKTPEVTKAQVKGKAKAKTAPPVKKIANDKKRASKKGAGKGKAEVEEAGASKKGNKKKQSGSEPESTDDAEENPKWGRYEDAAADDAFWYADEPRKSKKRKRSNAGKDDQVEAGKKAKRKKQSDQDEVSEDDKADGQEKRRKRSKKDQVHLRAECAQCELAPETPIVAQILRRWICEDVAESPGEPLATPSPGKKKKRRKSTEADAKEGSGGESPTTKEQEAAKEAATRATALDLASKSPLGNKREADSPLISGPNLMQSGGQDIGSMIYERGACFMLTRLKARGSRLMPQQHRPRRISFTTSSRKCLCRFNKHGKKSAVFQDVAATKPASNTHSKRRSFRTA
jgi:hypothetical protein